MPSKCILILLDGLGDRAHPSLGGLTPLQAAATPNLDRLAAAGANGLYHAASPGLALPSENAHFALFGYPPEDFPGRGALEAIGAGIALAPDEVAVLAHLVGLEVREGCLVLQHDLPEITEEEAGELAEAVERFETGGVRLRFRRARGLFGVVTLSGEVSPFITDTNPMREGRPLSRVLPWQSHSDNAAARKSAAGLSDYLRFVHRTLDSHPLNRSRRRRGAPPVNGLVTQRAGRLKPVTPFAERYALRGASIASGVVYWGLGAFLGLDVHRAADRADPGAEIAERLESARRLLADYDFIHVHTKAPDVAAHRKDPEMKRRTIEALDKGIGTALGELLADPELLLVVTADHSTPSSGPLVHSGEPVPVAFCGEGVRRDAVERFDEVSVAGGALGSLRGGELLDCILDYLELAKLQGIMDTPVDQPYWPGRYEPFKLEEEEG